MFAIHGSHEPGSHTRVPRRSRSRRPALAALVACCAVVPLTGATGAQAAEGYFCGSPTAPSTLSSGQHCIDPTWRSDYTALAARRVTAGGSASICVGPSQSSTSLSLSAGYSCGSGTSVTWIGSAPGYAAYWVASGSGDFYGWFQST